MYNFNVIHVYFSGASMYNFNDEEEEEEAPPKEKMEENEQLKEKMKLLRGKMEQLHISKKVRHNCWSDGTCTVLVHWPFVLLKCSRIF